MMYKPKFKRYVIPIIHDGDLTLAKLSIRRKKRKKGESKPERRCREIFESIFRAPFKKIRPDWLKNPVTGKNLELDGYNEDLKLAYEYDGRQHSEYTPHFHKDPNDFKYQLEKDKFKDRMCQLRSITLVRIPSFVVYGDLEKYIRTRLRQLYKIM